jgi:diguanylate cyclase (GGDEF)-like protein
LHRYGTRIQQGVRMDSREIEERRVEVLHRYAILDTPTEEGFDRITRLVSALLNVPIAAVTLVDRERQWFKSQLGLDVQETPRHQSFCSYTMAENGAMVVSDAAIDSRFAENELVTGDPNIRFYVGIPLKARDGTPLGALCGIDRQPREITKREIEILQDLANLTMDQLELRMVATLDGLTGAMRRTAFMAAAYREMELAVRSDRPLACLMLDADHFKVINDTHGHGVGDEILRAVVDVCKSNLRSSDFIGRVGGEEFCVILPGTDLTGALEAAERLRAEIASIRIAADGQMVGVTVSIGAVALDASDTSLEDIVGRADTGLYRAKAEGRNRVVPAWPLEPARVMTPNFTS